MIRTFLFLIGLQVIFLMFKKTFIGVFIGSVYKTSKLVLKYDLDLLQKANEIIKSELKKDNKKKVANGNVIDFPKASKKHKEGTR